MHRKPGVLSLCLYELCIQKKKNNAQVFLRKIFAFSMCHAFLSNFFWLEFFFRIFFLEIFFFIFFSNFFSFICLNYFAKFFCWHFFTHIFIIIYHLLLLRGIYWIWFRLSLLSHRNYMKMPFFRLKSRCVHNYLHKYWHFSVVVVVDKLLYKYLPPCYCCSI